MKIYLSADIKGVAGIAHWYEANKTTPAYQEFREEMAQEVIAACEGAMAAGASEIWIKDAHGSGRNILTADFPHARGSFGGGVAIRSTWCRSSTTASPRS